MNSALDIAKFVVNHSIGGDMTHLRLQKTLYYLYILFYRRYNKELISEFDENFSGSNKKAEKKVMMKI